MKVPLVLYISLIFHLLYRSTFSNLIRIPITTRQRVFSYEYPVYRSEHSELKLYRESEDLLPKEARENSGFVASVPDNEKKGGINKKEEDLKKELASIKLENFLNWQYFGQLSFGSNNETFSMIYDTGSSWIWIPGERCKTCEGSMKIFSCRTSSTCLKQTPNNTFVNTASGTPLTNPDQQPSVVNQNSTKPFDQQENQTNQSAAGVNSTDITSKLLVKTNKNSNGNDRINKYFEHEKGRIFHLKKYKNNTNEGISVAVTYGKGEIEGDIHLENVRLGKLEAKNQSFLLVYEVRDFQNHEFDGVCGLGFRPLEGGGLSLLDNLKAQGKINQKVFSFFLHNEIQSHADENSLKSELIIGGFDQRYVDGKINYFKVTNNSHWTIDLTKSFIGERILNKEPQQAIIDSGTSLILMPKREFTDIMKYLKSTLKKICVSQGMLVICACPDGSYHDFPVIKIEAEGKLNLTIQPDFYIRREKHRCSLLIGINGEEDLEQGSWVLGDVFMRQFYTIFDLEQKQIGIAKLPKFQTSENKFYFDVFFVMGGMAIAIVTGFIFIALIRWVSGLGKIKERGDRQSFFK
jgi:hypothetical protein